MPSATDLLSAADRVFWLYPVPCLWYGCSSLAFGLIAVAEAGGPTSSPRILIWSREFVIKIWMSAAIASLSPPCARWGCFIDCLPLSIFSRNLTCGDSAPLRGGPSHVPIVSLFPSSFSDVSRIFSRVGLDRIISGASLEFVRIGRRSWFGIKLFSTMLISSGISA